MTQRQAIVFLLFVAAALAAIQLCGRSDLMDNEQQRTAAWAMDAARNHHWIMQRDEAGVVASKPPMYTWLTAVVLLPFGHVNEALLKIPAVLATVLLALLIYGAGQKTWGAAAGLWAGLMFLLSEDGVRQMGLARMDGLFSLTAACAALLAYRAWILGRGWTWFWIAAAAATLTKGPFGLILGGAGLLAVAWERHRPDRIRLRGSPWGGAAIFLILTVGWFFWADRAMGHAVYQKLIVGGLVDQSVPHAHRLSRWISDIIAPPFYLLSRFFPWSVLTVLAIWRICRHPEADDASRRFARFAVCWLAVGTLCLCVPTHQRADLLLPMVPPAALLAGYELHRRTASVSARTLRLAAESIAVVAITLAALYVAFRDTPQRIVEASVEVRGLTRQVESQVGPQFPFTHVDDNFAVNFDLNTDRPLYYGPTRWTTGRFDANYLMTFDYASAVGLLEKAPAVYLWVCHEDNLREYLPAHGRPIYDLAHIHVDKYDLHLISNRPTLAVENDMALGVGPLTIQTHGLRWTWAEESDFALTGHGSVTFTNRGKDTRTIHIRFDSPAGQMTHALRPGETWEIQR